MTTIFAKNKFSLRLVLLIAHCSLLIALLSCEQPFKAGLGPIIDLQDPVGKITSPKTGAYIRGTAQFEGWAEDDSKVESVWIQLSSHPNVALRGQRKPYDGGTFYRIAEMSGSGRHVTFKFQIDTELLDDNGDRIFQDGSYLKLKLLVIDSIGKDNAPLDEYTFIVKNDGPQISLSLPPVTEGTGFGEVGSDMLNYGRIGYPDVPVKEKEGDEAIPPKNKPFPRIMDTEGWIQGLITDNEGINFNQRGFVDIVDKQGNSITRELFPPQIRFWQVYFDTRPEEDSENPFKNPLYDPLDDATSLYNPPPLYEAGHIPGDELPWIDLKINGKGDNRLIQTGKNNAAFLIHLPKVSGAYYAIQIRAQSTDVVHSPIEYPRDYNPNADWSNRFDPLVIENSYVLILAQEPSEQPKLGLYELQDIYGPNSKRDPGTNLMEYETLSIEGKDAQDLIDGNHVYVDKPIVSKNGPFTLRIWASHSNGIDNARVYWEKDDDKSVRGRFIWDPSSWDTPTNLPPHSPDLWRGRPIDPNDPYEKWGLNEYDARPALRSFVFTYYDEPNKIYPYGDKLGSIYGAMSNRSKVQKYIGDQNLTFDQIEAIKDPSLDAANWTDKPLDNGYTLPDGTYNIYIYARSKSDTRVAAPFVVTLSIDRTAPDIELNLIDGSLGEEEVWYNGKKYPPNTVNGVIRPKFLISESYTSDTGFRNGSRDFFKRPSPQTGYYPEQAFILIHEDDKAAMDTYLNSKPNLWPKFDQTLGNYPVFPKIEGVSSVLKCGLIIDAQCRIRTSGIYYKTSPSPNPEDTDKPLDDGMYWLYAFARDKAFNVGKNSWQINVVADTDKPYFDWDDNEFTQTVTEPDSSHDWPNAGDHEDSFITKDGIKNKLNAGTDIKVKIFDDDSLALGTASEDSKISVTFIGSESIGETVDGFPIIGAYTDNKYRIELTQLQIKQAFSPLTTYSGLDEDTGATTLKRAVKEITGTIRQSILLQLLKENSYYDGAFVGGKEGYNSLPDGIYRLNIKIQDEDDPAIKLRMLLPNISPRYIDPAKADFREDEVEFWIAVDSKPPEIEFTSAAGVYKPGDKLEGTVTDENGPITLVGWKVLEGARLLYKWDKGETQPIHGIDITDGLKKPEYNKINKQWEYAFAYEVKLPEDVTGNLNFELTFQDRFGNTRTKQLQYTVDRTPPKVSLTEFIETFKRDYRDVEFDPSWPQVADVRLNRSRLAVKVVRFTINAVDDNLEGVRWWLLPANVGATKDGWDASGTVSEFGAYPAPLLSLPTVVPAGGNTYYSSMIPGSAVPGFQGAFGVVDVENRKFTIAVDSQKMSPANGEYRLHIIARDKSGNQSSYEYKIAGTGDPVNNVFKEVFFFQEQDRPYISPGRADDDTDPTAPPRGLRPGVLFENTQLTWPTTPIEMDVTGGGPIIRGTIIENNGFFSDKDETAFWSGSITIWFSKDGKDLPASYNGKTLEQLIEANEDIPNYEKVILGGSDKGLSKQGRNLYLSIALTDYFPTAFDTDGRKRYIIKATDSPVNKFMYYPWSPPNPEGVWLDTDPSPSVRTYNWRQYAFVYDAKPPVVVIETPKKGTPFGRNNFDTNFILTGYIDDENLATDENGNYFLDHYVDSDTEYKTRFTLGKYEAGNSLITGVEKNSAADPSKITRVYFSIPAATVAAEIIKNFKTAAPPPDNRPALTEGSHTLNVFTRDQSGKEGAAWTSFTKDMAPPTIAFSNLTGDNKPYDDTNKSIVSRGWWGMTTEARKNLLFGVGSTTTPLPLTTISYDSTGTPEIRGNVTDLVSPIAVTLTTNTNVGDGDINYDGGGAFDPSPFHYWIDKDATPAAPASASYPAVIDGAVKEDGIGGKSIRWTINLTNDGTYTTGTALGDGVHTIMLTAADTAGEVAPPDYMIAFRLDSKVPEATITSNGEENAVYGNVQYQNNPMFTITLNASDANLKELQLKLVRKATKDGEKDEPKVERIFDPRTPASAELTNPEWIYVPRTVSIGDDLVKFTGTYNVNSSLFDGVDDGKYEAIVVAVDWANNKSEEFVYPFTYDKTPPKIDFTYPNGKNPDDLTPKDFIETIIINDKEEAVIANDTVTPKNNINRLTIENLRIQGSVTDFTAVKDVQSKVWKWNWLNNGWVVIEDWTTMPDIVGGKADFSTNTLNNVSWTKNLLGQDATGIGSNLDLREPDYKGKGKPYSENLEAAEGLYRIQIRAMDESTIASPGADYLGVPQTTPPTSVPRPGKGNPIASEFVYFYFDRTNPTLTLDKINDGETSMQTYYPKLDTGFKFEGKVTDTNRFAKVEVTFVSGTKTDVKSAVLSRPSGNTTDPANPTFNTGGETQYWIADFADATTYPDGRYKVTIVAYDMAGRKSAKEEKSFILDSTPPGLKFTEPVKLKDKGYGEDADPDTLIRKNFASAIVNGGETSIITGETWDRPGDQGEKGSESGISQMWFRLGYIEGINDFPDKDRIKAEVNTLLTRFSNLSETDFAKLSLADRNAWMDAIAEYRADTASGGTGDNDNKGNSWFRLGGKRKTLQTGHPVGDPVPVPTGFVINNPNIYDWRMEIPDELSVITSAHPDYFDYNKMNITHDPLNISKGYPIGGLKLYCNDIWIKGRPYDVGANPTRQMVRSVDGQTGIYRLPLWVRLVDVAGNVEYYCHDIWIYPDGDVPWTTIENPANGAQSAARGGTISVDGTAHSNKSVYDVIFRVFADSEANTDLDGTKNIGLNPGDAAGYPHTANVVKINGYDLVTDPEILARIPNGNPPAGTYTAPDGRTTNYRTTDWQRANLSMKGGSGEPMIPWNIMLNADDQIRKLIDTQGFASQSGGSNDTIRVWLEVFVFNGTSSPIRSSVYADDKLNTGGGRLYGNAVNNPPYYLAATPATDRNGPRPYVRAFYLKKSAPQITHPNVGSWKGTSDANPNENFNWRDELATANPDNPAGYGYKGAGTEKRRDKFAIKAILDPSPSGSTSTGLSEVAYRIKLNGDTYGEWKTVWTGTTIPSVSPAFKVNDLGVSINTNNVTVSPNRTRYNFIYAFDSKNLTDAEAFAAINGVNWINSGGTITVNIRIRDTSTPKNEAEYSIQVSVDNFAPVADEYDYITNSKVAGTNVDFMGRVFDYATTPSEDAMTSEYTPRKVQKVYAWFEKEIGGSRQFVNMNGGTPATAPPSSSNSRKMTALKGRHAEMTYGSNNDTVNSIELKARGTSATDNITYPIRANGEEPYNAQWIREIDQASGQPQNKMVWSSVNLASYDDVRWSFNLDTTNLPDGDLFLCYIVVDEAENATYYEQKTSVRNRYPEITRVTLYTNNIGIGSAYTAPASVDYNLNDYRSKMFASYADYVSAAAASPGRLDQLGFLNSGFISKNKYLGVQVETLRGNRPLNFRLQHVTRQRVALTKTKLQEMVTNKDNSSFINLYTIAWHGNYTSKRWRDIGVPIDNPTLGTHFVFSMTQDELDAYPDPGSQTATGTLPEVWQYTPVVSAPGEIAPDVDNNHLNETGPVVYGNGDPTPEAKFEFRGDGSFDATPTTPRTKINEYNGSHPDDDDANKSLDNPRNTAFFLIRVWDTVGIPRPTPTVPESWNNDQLFDAVVVGMNVYLTDTGYPSARLYDLNPYTEISVTPNDPSATIRDASDPQAIGSNIVRGGLYNAGKSERELVKSGYINPRASSRALNLASDLKNGLYEYDSANARKGPIISGLPLPDYPLKVTGDTISNTGLDKVSGKIILRGVAWDDQLIDEIRIKIGAGSPAESDAILKLDPRERVNGNPNPNFGKMVATSGNEDKAFAVETLHWKTGHTVEWAYVWDTEKLPSATGVPATGVQIQVQAKDYNSAAKLTSREITANTGDTDTLFHNTVSVDIVPYITGFRRGDETAFATKRSLQGWFSFYQGEEKITLLGYNFGDNRSNVAISLYDGATTYTLTRPSSDTNASPFRFNIPNTAKSGRIDVRVNTTDAYNHNASAIVANSWNRESNTYTPGSTLWINKPYAHIWRTTQDNGAPRTYLGTQPDPTTGTNSSTGLDHPGMALEYATGGAPGTLHGAWSVYGQANVVYGTNTGSSNLMYTATPGEPFGTPDISIFQGGGATSANVGLAHQTDGRPRLVVRAKVNETNTTNNTPQDSTVLLQDSSSNGSTQRWQNIRISKAAANTADSETNTPVGRIYMTSFNADTKGLWYASRSGTTNSQMFIDGTRMINPGNAGDETPAQYPPYINETGSGITRATNAGEYNAVDYDNIGPIIAYYDGVNDTVRIAFGANDTPGTGNWTRRYLLPATHPLRVGSGTHISIKVDRLNGIHLAFYNSARTTVVYYYAKDRSFINVANPPTPGDGTATDPNPNVRCHTIDNVVTGGIRTDISIHEQGTQMLPWIVYGDSSRTDNYDGVRVAYRSGTGTTSGVQFTGTLICPVTNTEITGWEALSMPAKYTIKNDRLNIEAWPPTVRGGTMGSEPGWNAAIGYGGVGSNGVDMFRVGYFYYPKFKGY
jgi:hypothetical protein